MSKETTLLNQNIKFDEVRCIGSDGEQLGIISSREAQNIADDAGLDLVLISADAKPPVCKIMDYKKFCYQRDKKIKEARKKQKQIEIKEIKLSTQIAQNDINYKVKHAKEFLQTGKHVKFKVFLKGREMTDPKQGFNVIYKVIEMLETEANTEDKPILEGRYINITLTPKVHKKDT